MGSEPRNPIRRLQARFRDWCCYVVASPLIRYPYDETGASPYHRDWTDTSFDDEFAAAGIENPWPRPSFGCVYAGCGVLFVIGLALIYGGYRVIGAVL